MNRTHGIILLALVLLGASGCIRSRVHITSEPSGADVIFNEKDWGPTPVEIPIVWYWYYTIRFEKDGYQPVETEQKFRTPVWALPPLDLIAEALPFNIPDNRYVKVTLVPVAEE